MGFESLGPACRELVSRNPRLFKLLEERVRPSPELVRALEALSSHCRLSILMLLAKARAPVPLCVIAAVLGREPRAVSYHLRELREAGLVREERKEGFSFYTLNRERVKGILKGLERLLLGTSEGQQCF